jgi:hypothetical protein
MRILTGVVSGLAGLELLLSGLSMVSVMTAAKTRFADLVGALPPDPVLQGLGVVHLAAFAGVVAGSRAPRSAVAAGLWLAAYAAYVLLRQVQSGQRGSQLFAYALFLTLGLALAALRAPTATALAHL